MKLIIFLAITLFVFAQTNNEENQNRELSLCDCDTSDDCSCGYLNWDYEEIEHKTPSAPCKPAIPIQSTNSTTNTTGPSNCSCDCNCSCYSCNCSCVCIIIPPSQNVTQPNKTCPKSKCANKCKGSKGSYVEKGINEDTNFRNEDFEYIEDVEELQTGENRY